MCLTRGELSSPNRSRVIPYLVGIPGLLANGRSVQLRLHTPDAGP